MGQKIKNMEKIYVYDNHEAAFSTFYILLSWCLQSFNNDIIIETITVGEFEKLEDKNGIALFMPGGSSRYFQEKILKKDTEYLEAFVRRGGILSVSCGSAYWLSKELYFERHDTIFNKPTNSGNLVLFDGLCKGPIQEISPGKFSPDPENVKIIKIISKNGETFVYYHGGPEFLGDSSFVPTSSYEGTKINASGYKEIGAGVVLFFSFHIECTQTTLKPFSDFYKKQSIIKKIKALPENHSVSVLKDLYPRLKNYFR